MSELQGLPFDDLGLIEAFTTLILQKADDHPDLVERIRNCMAKAVEFAEIGDEEPIMFKAACAAAWQMSEAKDRHRIQVSLHHIVVMKALLGGHQVDPEIMERLNRESDAYGVPLLKLWRHIRGDAGIIYSASDL